MPSAVEREIRDDLRARAGPLIGQVYSPFLWRHWATGWYTLRSLESRTIVLTDRREYAEEWPWPPEFLVQWDFESTPPEQLTEIDLFHLHNGWTATSRGLELIEAFPSKHYVASFIGTDVNRHARLDENGQKYRRLFEAIDAVVAPCEFLAEKLIGLGCDSNKIRVIPWGVEPTILSRKDPADFSPPGELRVCMLARMIELKGTDMAIEAAGIAAERAVVTLEVGGHGPERQRLLRIAEVVNRRHGAEVVRIHGDGEAMLSHGHAMYILRRSDCLVNCSKPMPDGAEETMSVAMLEAQMLGLPVIAVRCGGAAEIVDQDRTGWLLRLPDEATPEGLANALVRLALDRNTRVRMGTAAAARARGLFSTSVVAESFDRLYSDVLTSTAPDH